ncbi:type II and III secretion system protein [Desulfurobacterium thermolithotrophum DSM 11699]|uniref:Type II and III secretion system protein n=1 Tax=Desulfurobacterium thermolithotrophum (strain DSM 11699 / BSA) TaxID=868864 RepID=F0S2G2_DESTD|nr:type IV pilus secretin PilQ [Desulfurobacterium thermolithotrophum]ADY73034.1 type II and III secretion system protein [Desulfurobacterium thermolithotrophum DSM 11699]
MSKWLIPVLLLSVSTIANAGTITELNAIYDKNIFEISFQKKGNCEVVPLIKDNKEISVKLENCTLNRSFTIGERGDLIKKVTIKPIGRDTIVDFKLKKTARLESLSEKNLIRLKIIPSDIVRPNISLKKFSKGEILDINLIKNPANIFYKKSANTYIIDISGLKLKNFTISPNSKLIKNIEVFSNSQGSTIKVHLVKSSPAEIVVKDNKVKLKIFEMSVPTKTSFNSLNPTNKKYISLKFNNADVRSVVKAIANIAGINIVFDPEVKGTVSIDFEKPVFWKDALEAVLTPLGLTYKETENYMRILPKTKIIKQELQEPTKTYIVNLNYANAEEIEKEIKELVKKLDKRERITVNKSTNSLLLTVTKKHYQEIMNLLKKLDKPMKQVIVKAKIVQISTSAAKDFGFGWLIGGYNHMGTPPSSYITGSYGFGLGSNTGVLPFINETSYSSLYNIPVGESTLALGILNKSQNLKVEIALKALQLDGNAKIVSSPEVLTLNNQEATIEQGIEIPYRESTVASGGATTYTVSFKRASLILKVKPHITNNNEIILDLEVRKDSPNYEHVALTGSNEPAIDTRNVKSRIKVANGNTIVIGGIYEKEKSKSKTGVPVISNIPLLGWLFKQESVKFTEKNLLIFITPKVVE